MRVDPIVETSLLLISSIFVDSRNLKIVDQSILLFIYQATYAKAYKL